MKRARVVKPSGSGFAQMVVHADALALAGPVHVRLEHDLADDAVRLVLEPGDVLTDDAPGGHPITIALHSPDALYVLCSAILQLAFDRTGKKILATLKPRRTS